MIYLGWYDDNPKKKIADKINEAITRYIEKYQIEPNICLVTEQELISHPAISVRPAHHVRPNYFYIGHDSNRPSSK